MGEVLSFRPRAQAPPDLRSSPVAPPPALTPARKSAEPKPKGVDRFFEAECWGLTAKGNPTIVISLRGWSRRVVLFQQRETMLWRWLIMVEDGYEEFSQDSWHSESEARFDAC